MNKDPWQGSSGSRGLEDDLAELYRKLPSRFPWWLLFPLLIVAWGVLTAFYTV